MKSFRKTLTFRVPDRMGFVNITPSVEESLREKRRERRALPGQRDARHGGFFTVSSTAGVRSGSWIKIIGE
jgi:hypothetical protein